MKKYIILFSLIVTFVVFSCKEVYKPEIRNVPKILVVDGLITNEIKAHTIHLTNAIQFDTLTNVPETGATVYVTDNNGSIFDFKEKTPGYYSSDSLYFKPIIKSTYTLTVETKNKKVYKSSEQELLSKGTLSEPANIPKNMQYYYTLAGDFQYLNITGSEFFISFDLQSEPNPYYRFSNSILVEYLSKSPNLNLEESNSKSAKNPYITSYCWKKYNPNEYFNINDRQYNHTGYFQHDLGFFPFDSLFYSVRSGNIEIQGRPPKTIYVYQNIYQYIVSFKQYHLNQDVYKYYESLNKQLEAKQRLFDPISFQIVGNLKCINDPNEKVFGLFEASSVIILSYKIEYDYISKTFVQGRITAIDLDSIPDSGNRSQQPPHFWIY